MTKTYQMVPQVLLLDMKVTVKSDLALIETVNANIILTVPKKTKPIKSLSLLIILFFNTLTVHYRTKGQTYNFREHQLLKCHFSLFGSGSCWFVKCTGHLQHG